MDESNLSVPKETLDAFLAELTELSKKHGVVLAESFGNLSVWLFDEEFSLAGQYELGYDTEFQWNG